MFPIAGSAVAIAFLIAAAAHAGASPPTAKAPPGLTDMQTGRLLLRAGRLEHARAFLQQARPPGEEEEIERLFLLGRIEMRLGLPRSAIERFEAILVRRPGLSRWRRIAFWTALGYEYPTFLLSPQEAPCRGHGEAKVLSHHSGRAACGTSHLECQAN